MPRGPMTVWSQLLRLATIWETIPSKAHRLGQPASDREGQHA